MEYVNNKLEEFKKYINAKRVAIIGLGVSNIPLINYLYDLGARITVFDQKDENELNEQALNNVKAKGFEIVTGKECLKAVNGFDIIFRSPSALPTIPELVAEVERGAILTSEIEMLLKLAPCKVIGVTGTEGKTTTTVGLADGMQRLGKSVMVALREPSLGPVFGVKGGAAGGGYAQVVPMEDINLHFTGDFHAIGAANNLLAAMIDNHIFQGNALNIDPRKITWRRCVDMNDRQLRNVVDGLGGKTNGMPREDGYDITVASEIMAVLCLASDIKDLKERLSKIIIGYTYGKVSEQKPVTAGDLHAEGAMTALLKDALKPNLVQTLEHVPAIVHGGPFANIAHGCNSVTATKMAMKLADYAITEAGFGADLGAEKFLDIKCRMAGLKPSAVVIVATVRALKYNGGVAKADLNNENLEALEKGIPNLLKHVSNIKNVYKLPCVVAINAFPTDTKAELDFVEAKCKELGVNVALSEVWAKGGEGGIKLAEEVIRLVEEPNDFSYAYELEGSIEDKLNQIVQKVYGGKKVVLTANAQKQAKQLEALGFGNCPICAVSACTSLI